MTPSPAPSAGPARRPLVQLDRASAPPATILVRGARLLDPRAGIDLRADLLLRDGAVAELGDSLEAPEGAELVDGTGLHAFPAFVDPHVHLRTPGREDEEDIDSGSRAAAAGGFCAILAQPNTVPVVDSAPVLRSLRERARAEARIPVGFMAAITVGQRGEALTEMAELADAGAAGFTDDGLPVRSAGVLRQALQYQRLAGRVIALHEEDPALSGAGAMHEGEVSALLGVAGIPSVSESTMVARDCALALYEQGRIHVQHVSARETVAAIERAKAIGTEVSCEATPHHLLLTDEAVRGLDTNLKMNPPLRAEADRQALIDGLRSGAIDCVATDHAPHAREEKEQPFELAPMGVTGLETAFAALHTGLVLPGVLELGLLVDRMTCGGEPFGLAAPSLAPGSPANVCLVDLDAEWEVGEAGYESRSTNCAFAGRRLTGRVRMTVADGAVAYRERTFALGAVA
ncbi:MAG TPA: dihydroorotase [Thermoleophilaceae bacterium]|nr:dihydroorotase [Thermoleophilaceae bacterium]